MSQAVLTLELPEAIYEHVCRAAKAMKQPVEAALVTIVTAATPSLEKVPAKYRPELEALEDLGDKALWQATECSLPPAQQRQLGSLLEKNQRTELTERDQQTLSRLRAAADKLMLKRSYAYLLLKYRGHQIPNLADLSK